MKINFKLEDCRPFSINRAYYKNRGITRECRLWRQTIISAAKPHIPLFKEFRESFDPQINGIFIHITHHIPFHKFYTKKGDISIQSMDLTNVEKLLVDILFDARFYDRGELDNINLNDKYIVKLISEKVVDTEWGIDVELDITTLNKDLK